jgi:hypothetical protein
MPRDDTMHQAASVENGILRAVTTPNPRAPNPAAANSVDDPLARPRRSAVVIAILVTVLLAASIFALLFYRGYVLPEPTRVLVVRADSSWDGIELTVEGESLREPRVTHIEKLGNFVVPFFLWPGKYTLHVKSQGADVLTRNFDLTNNPSDEIDLTRVMSAPTTSPAAASTNPTTVPTSVPTSS